MGTPTFAAFVTEKYPRGIGASLGNFEKLIAMRHRYEANHAATRERMDWLRRTVRDLLNPEQEKNGTNQHTPGGRDNITPTERGTDPDYLLRRLKRDAPEAAARVLRGEVSAHRAAVEAGIRKPTATFPLDPVAMARTLKRRLSEDELDQLIEALGEVGG